MKKNKSVNENVSTIDIDKIVNDIDCEIKRRLFWHYFFNRFDTFG